MTAWFHSHPGLKIFLSDFDLSVQEGFSTNKKSLKMLALVLDPYTQSWDTGIFSYKADGSAMNNSKDSKRFFSLDTMYKWAMKAQTLIPLDIFKINMHDLYPDSVCGKIFFENTSILEMKRLFEDNKEISDTVCGYVVGEQIIHGYNNSDIILKNVIMPGQEEEEEAEGMKAGFIICTDDGEADILSLINKQESDIEQFLFAIIYNYSDQSISIIPRNSKMAFNKPSEEGKLEFSEMIEWTRKRK